MNRLRISPGGLRVFRSGFRNLHRGGSHICLLFLFDRFRIYRGGFRDRHRSGSHICGLFLLERFHIFRSEGGDRLCGWL